MKLDQKDQEIIKLVIEGKSQKQIGKEVFLCEDAIKSRIRKLKEKFDCPNTPALVYKLTSQGLV